MLRTGLPRLRTLTGLLAGLLARALSQVLLHSLPQAVGIPAAFLGARFMHLAMLGLLVWFGLLFQFHPLGWAGIGAVALLLAYEHSLVSPRDLTRLNAAFFTMNGVIATVFFAFVAADLWLRRGI